MLSPIVFPMHVWNIVYNIKSSDIPNIKSPTKIYWKHECDNLNRRLESDSTQIKQMQENLMQRYLNFKIKNIYYLYNKYFE